MLVRSATAPVSSGILLHPFTAGAIRHHRQVSSHHVTPAGKLYPVTGEQGCYTEGMHSIKEIFKKGPGPSSSHTLGPMNAALYMKHRHPQADAWKVRLQGSLALTGKGHLTDDILIRTLGPATEVTFDLKGTPVHPNTMYITALQDGEELETVQFVSIGGGKLEINGVPAANTPEIYPHSTMAAIRRWCKEQDITLDQYVDMVEGPGLNDYLDDIMDAMLASVREGLAAEGILPGSLKLKRVAKELHEDALACTDPDEIFHLLLASYAFAASEQNAAGGFVVTAPTMGSCGILPALIYHFLHDRNYSRAQLLKGLKVAGLVGNLIQTNATISGAKGGCQAEVGAACAMGSAMIACAAGQSDGQVEYAAEMGLEHHLGLTCDPVGGYVMIPCIERNAMAALRCVDNARLSRHILRVKHERVSFDHVVEAMNITGMKLPMELKESSLGGLAVVIPDGCDSQGQ
uniref:L-serine ammonia-lyase n=5 Tax=Faecalibaculum rodentium TaxID=1702221 RepID=A0A140DSM9_9FIRM|nr:L-serine ammonia-lyase [Faecalibaculum rodentium]